MREEGKGTPNVHLDVRKLGEVYHVLEHLAADDNLALDGPRRVALPLLSHLHVHGAHIRPYLHIIKDLDELHEVFD